MTTSERESTPQDIEREAEASRRRLSSTLDELRDNLTPSHVVEELLDNARDGGASMLRALGKAARENPIPTLLIGTGCAMFLMGGAAASTTGTPRAGMRRHETETGGTVTRRRPEEEYGTSYADRSDTAGLAAAARDKAGAAMETVSEGMASARESVAGAASEIGERAKRVAEGVGETYQAYSGVALDGARHAGERVKETVSRSSEKVRENVTTLLHEQPLVLGALGVAIGAAIGAMLPRTQTEDRMLGETSDALKGTAAKMVGEQYEHAKEAAAKVAEDVRDIAAERGLTADSAGEVVGELGRRVKEAAGTGGSSQDARSSMQQAADQRSDGGRQQQGGHGPAGGGSQMSGGGQSETLAIVEVTPDRNRS
jgi:ElaB/YqjD/DUF883 family membrane-anchored ribosome-binding protein